jgi:hypothetical protein
MIEEGLFAVSLQKNGWNEDLITIKLNFNST